MFLVQPSFDFIDKYEEAKQVEYFEQGSNKNTSSIEQ